MPTAMLSVTLSLTLAAQAPARRDARVVLALRPWPGDALRVQVEHETEERGTMPLPAGDSTVVTRTATTVRVRTVVESADAAGAVLRAHVDSVAVQASGGRPDARRRRVDESLALQGRRVRLRLGTDGAVTLLDPSAPAVAVAALAPILERVPAVFPEGAVGVGDRWTRRVALPGAEGDAVVAEFRLDSLTHHGDRAWVSVRGGMDDAAAQAETAGTVQGWLLLDRRRGWIVASRLVLALRTVARRGNAPPMRFSLRLEQRMREVP